MLAIKGKHKIMTQMFQQNKLYNTIPSTSQYVSSYDVCD